MVLEFYNRLSKLSFELEELVQNNYHKIIKIKPLQTNNVNCRFHEKIGKKKKKKCTSIAQKTKYEQTQISTQSFLTVVVTLSVS